MNKQGDILAELVNWRERIGAGGPPGGRAEGEIALLSRAIAEIERLRAAAPERNGEEIIAGEDLNASNDE